MKLGKTVLIFLASGIFVVLVAGLFMAYSQQSQEQSQLHQELYLARLTIAKYSPGKLSLQQRELESQLTHTESQLRAVKANLRQSIESIEVTDTLFEVAETSEVEIIEIGSPGLTSKELEGITHSVLSLRAKVEGDVPNLIDFILELSRKFPSSMVESVEIDVPEVTEEEAETGGEEIEEPAKPSAVLKLSIYTYEGD